MPADESKNGHEFTRLDAPAYYASTVEIIWAGNDCTIVASRPHPRIRIVDGKQEGTVSAEPQVVLQFSPQTAKDLLKLLQRGIENYEERLGTITTEYTTEKAAE
ncbi:hypothetical protein [Nitratireductor sp. PBL-C9]|uniref:hypothetical protein n=1 Tax=Nitratireductor sp. PBL-C9 TaxID=3435013 RepID=UPI003D7E306A